MLSSRWSVAVACQASTDECTCFHFWNKLPTRTDTCNARFYVCSGDSTYVGKLWLFQGALRKIGWPGGEAAFMWSFAALPFRRCCAFSKRRCWKGSMPLWCQIAGTWLKEPFPVNVECCDEYRDFADSLSAPLIRHAWSHQTFDAAKEFLRGWHIFGLLSASNMWLLNVLCG